MFILIALLVFEDFLVEGDETFQSGKKGYNWS